MNRIGRGAIKARVLAATSQTLWDAAKKGEAGEAYQTASKLMIASEETASDPEIILACLELVRANLTRGTIANAIAVTEHMPQTGARNELLRKIAQRQAEDGDLPAAVATVKRMNPKHPQFGENHRAGAFEFIVAAEVKSGQNAIFDRLMEDESDPIVRARLLLGRANGLLARSPPSE